MRQSINVPLRLPACLLFAVIAFPGDLFAQGRYRVTQQENFRRDPGPNGRLLAQVRAGSELEGTDVRDGWVQITLEGWIWAESIRDNSTGNFDAEVSAASGENLRTGPNDRVIARLGTGFLLEVLEEENNWARVRRSGWMWSRSLQRLGADPPPQTAPNEDADPEPQSSPTSPAAPVATSDYSVVADSAPLHAVPEGDSSGMLAPDTPVRLLERRAGWVRVQIEGWVPEDAIQPTDGSVMVGVSGAEVRARPSEFEGRVVQWIVQYIALRTADELRAELPAGTRYMLVRGPLPEAGFAYVVVNAEQAQQIADVAPLAHLVIDARIVVSRSRYLSNTVMELLNFSVRQP